MSSDPSVSEVAATTQNGSSKRPLDGESEKKVAATKKEAPQDSTTNVEREEENPSKRMKIEAVGEGETVVEENPLDPVDTNDSTSTGPASSLPVDVKDKKDKGDNGVDTGSGDVAPTDTDTTDTDAGTTTVASRRGKTSEPSNIFSPAVTRSRSTISDKKKENEASDDAQQPKALRSTAGKESKGRWRVHQMAEDYTNLVGSMMYPATQFQAYGYSPEERQYPMEKISLLGFIKSPLRRPTIIEKWSPYEIAIFEGSMLHYGKEFRSVSRQIGTKTTQEVIDFYYVWKKTGHYKKWKQQFISDEDLIEDFHIPIKKPKR